MGGEQERERDRIHVGGSPVHCPYCKGEFEDLKSIVACAACGARHHEGCHATHGRCATCGSAEKLVPAAPRKRSRGDPLAGSKIEVRRDGQTTTYSWPFWQPSDTRSAWLHMLTIFLIPYVLPIILRYRGRSRCEVRVTPDEIELPVAGPVPRTVCARRGDVGKIQTRVGLTVDVGIERLMLLTGVFNSGLTLLELEWLADQLNAWKDEA